MTNKSKIINVKCPLCEIDECESVYKNSIETGSSIGKIEINNVMCKNCGLMYMNPRPNSEFWYNYYVNERNSSANTYHSIESGSRHSLLSEERKNFVYNQLKEKKHGKLLDVGCGQGDFLLKLNLPDLELWGLEQSKYAAKKASEKGLKIINDRMENIKNEKFDIICAISSLEHVNNPTTIIKKMTEMLNLNGYLFIEVPDSTKPYLTIGEFFTFEHLTHFTFGTLERMLGKYDIKIIESDNKVSIPNLRILGQKIEGYSKTFKPTDDRNKLLKSLNKYKKEKKELENGLKNKFNKLCKIWEEKSSHIAVYGAGVHSLFLLGLIDFQKYIKCFIDSDKSKQNTTFLKWQIYGPECIKNLKIDSIVISSKDYEEEIYQHIKHYKNEDIEIIKCYNNS